MLFVTKLSSFIHCLILKWFCFCFKYFGAIEEDEFTFWKRYLWMRKEMYTANFMFLKKETIFWRAVLNVLPKRIALELIYVTEEFVVYGILHFHPAFWWRMQANYASDTSRYVRFINIWNLYHFNVWFVNLHFFSNVSNFCLLRYVFYIHYISFNSYIIKRFNISKTR